MIAERRFVPRAALCAALLSLAVVFPADALPADPTLTRVPERGPLDASLRSFVADDIEGAPIFEQPQPGARFLGRLLVGASMPVQETRSSRGCRRLWIRIGPEGWVCGDRGNLSQRAAYGTPPGLPTDRNPLPWSYVFAGTAGVRMFRNLPAALANSQDPVDFVRWEPHWGFALEERSQGEGRSRILQTRNGRYVRRGELYRAEPSGFVGGRWETLERDAPGVPFGWVIEDGTRVWNSPEEAVSGRVRGGLIERLSLVHVYGTRHEFNRTWARTNLGWMHAERVHWVTPAAMPTEVRIAPRERWIDVDLSSQTLIAYEGATPVYATLISSGGLGTPTHAGVFRIWGRYLVHVMDNTDRVQGAGAYRLSDVPWVQFFDGDRGFHAVYWHDRFGHPRSHGCVNLSPGDAAYLFSFTSHPLPDGWLSRPIPEGQGTVVRVRGRATSW